MALNRKAGDELAWYQVSSEEVFRRLGTTERGLTKEEADKRILKYGPNKIVEEEKQAK